MEKSIEKARSDLLSYCTGEPLIVTLSSATDVGDEYNLQVFVRSIADFTPSYIKSVQLRLFLPTDYPNSSPRIKLYKTKLFHPNFSASGDWLDNNIHLDEAMDDYLMRIVRTLQFKELNHHRLEGGGFRCCGWKPPKAP